MNSFVLKIIACICMLCDHISLILFDEITVLNYIGRFTFIIFAFQIAQGYIYTHNLKEYIKRLIFFAFISQIPFMLFYHFVLNSFAINVIFTLLFGLFAILIYDKYNKFVGICSCFSLGLIAQFCKFDYGFFGVFIIFMFYLLHNKKIYMTCVFILTVIFRFCFSVLKNGLSLEYTFLGNPYSMCMYFTCLAIVPILLYNNKKGKDVKYLFYIFYPTHLLALTLLSILI